MEEDNLTDAHLVRIIGPDENFERSPGIVSIMRDFGNEYTGNTEVLQFGVGSHCETFGRYPSGPAGRAIYKITNTGISKIKRKLGLRTPKIIRANHSTLVLAEVKEGFFNGIKPFLGRQKFMRPLMMAEDFEEYGGEYGSGLHLDCNPDLDLDRIRNITSNYKPMTQGKEWLIYNPYLMSNSKDWNHWYSLSLNKISSD